MEVFFEKGGFEKIAVRRDRFGINPLYIARKRYHSNRRQLRQGAGAGLAAIDGPVHSSSFLPLALALR